MRTIPLPETPVLPSVGAHNGAWWVVWQDAQHTIKLSLDGTAPIVLGRGVHAFTRNGYVTWRSADHVIGGNPEAWQQVLRAPVGGGLRVLPVGPAGGVQSGVLGGDRVAWTSADGRVWSQAVLGGAATLEGTTTSSEGLAYIDPATGQITSQDDARHRYPGMTRPTLADDGVIAGEAPNGGIVLRRSGFADVVVLAGQHTPWPRVAANGLEWALVALGVKQITIVEPSDFGTTYPPTDDVSVRRYLPGMVTYYAGATALGRAILGAQRLKNGHTWQQVDGDWSREYGKPEYFPGRTDL